MTRLLLSGAAVAAAWLAAAAPVAAQPAAQAADLVETVDPPAKRAAPFAFADFTWLTGNPRTKDAPLDTGAFTGEFRADISYTYSFNRPSDHSISGSSEVFRHGEIQVTHVGAGGDFHWNNVRGRLMTQFGLYSQTMPAGDGSPARGQWNLADAYRFVSEANAGYHWDALHGVNIDAGLFTSFTGLWSYYQFDNWTYQPAFISQNMPWYMNGVRIQIFLSDTLKIEPWIVNGWQAYGTFNSAPGLGGQVLWRPNGRVSVTFNAYWGSDTLGNPHRKCVHSDNHVQVKYLDRPAGPITKAAFTFTLSAGCEYGGGVSCGGGSAADPFQYAIGAMAYHRLWLSRDRAAFTVGGGTIRNPGRYMMLTPPVNGATATSGTPHFTYNPGDQFSAWEAQAAFDWMPSQFVTFRSEFTHRDASVPYFSGPGGVTPPGGNTGAAGSLVEGWVPDLRHSESRVTAAILVKF